MIQKQQLKLAKMKKALQLQEDQLKQIHHTQFFSKNNIIEIIYI
jgi:hypothetical protein